MMTKFIKFHFATIAIVLLAIFVSCSVFTDNSMPDPGLHNPDYYEDVLVPPSLLPLYANLGVTGTKASHGESDYVNLESLLDRTKLDSKTFKQYHLTEIPFKSNTSPCLAILSKNPVVSDESYSEISLFLVETIDTEQNITDRKVVTMIPDENYKIRRNAGEAYSYINKGVFSGIILYSNLDGSFRDVYVFGGDFSPIRDAQVINHSDVSSYSEVCYLFVVNNMVTKCDENGVCLDPSICIAYREDSSQEDEDAPPLPSGNGDGPIFPGTGGGGGSTPPSGNGSSSEGGNEQEPIINNPDESTEQVPEEKQKYVVSLYSAEGGTTEGSGVYLEGAWVTLRALNASSYIFDRWVGDLAGGDESVNRILRSDINSTAYFRKLLEVGPTRPCIDTLTGIMNPLMEMKLAPSNTWSSNYKGATYGKTRYKQVKDPLTGEKYTVPLHHGGIDLFATPGTPIYSMYDGVVSGSIYVTEQPMRSKAYGTKNYYPSGYKGDKNDSGNRVYIDSYVNGANVSVGYCHLLANTPVAVNPRTGEPFKPGDVVYQGEIIAYAGRTGNAYDVHYPHLHLVVKKNNNFVDPEPYINGKLNTIGQDENKLVSSTEVNNIKCH